MPGLIAHGTGIVLCALVAAAYFATGRVGLSLAFLHPSATPVWAPSGIALAAVLVFGTRVWPGILVAAFLVNQATAGTVLTSALIAAGNVGEALLGAHLVRRFAHGRAAFERTEDVFKMAFAGAVSPTVSAAVGGLSLTIAGFAPWASLWPISLTWWLGDVAGILIVAPLLVLWAHKSERLWPPAMRLEAGLLFAFLAVLSAGIFGPLYIFPESDYPLEFLTLLLLIWAAFRLGQRAATSAVFLLSIIVLVGTLHGYGPFARTDPNVSLLLVQAFMASISLSTMALAAAVADRQRAARALLHASAQAVAAEEVARREIAELLHGRVQSRLLLAWRYLVQCEQAWSADPEQAKDLLGRATREIDGVREREIRHASYRLHPPFLREGLRPAVEELAEPFRGALTIIVEASPTFSALDTPIRNRIPETLRLAAYRIIEEALSNAVRHGNARTVRVELDVDRERNLAVAVQDDGRGLDPATVKPGLGLGSIEARVQQEHGSWEIDGAPGAGARVSVRLPLARAPAPGTVSSPSETPRTTGPWFWPHAPSATDSPAGTRGWPAPGD